MKHVDEQLRLKDVDSYKILDTPAEKEFDDIVRLAADFFETPVALITVIGSERTWFKARHGMQARQTSAGHSFCTRMLDDPGAPLIVTNASTDVRFKNNLLVKEKPHIRFYLGIPLISANGYLLGSLCVVDWKPRKVKENELRVLKLLAAKVMDLMELRKASLQLKQEKEDVEKRLDHISENSPVALFQLSVDKDQTISFNFLSKSIDGILSGLNQDNLKDDAGLFFQAIHPDYRLKVKEQLLEAAEKGKSFDVIFRTQIAGNTTWCLARANVIHDKSGNTSFYGALEDISTLVEREMKAREALRQSRQQYKKMVDEVEDYVILLLDSDGNIQNWNRGAEKIKGYYAGEIIGKNHSVFYTEEDIQAQKPAKLLQIAAEAGKAVDTGWRIKKDGNQFMAFVVITALHSNGGDVIGFSKVTRDMTKEREHLMAIEKQNEQLSEIAYIQSHLVRAPLSRIMGIHDLLTGAELNADEKSEMMAAMNDSCKELDYLIHQISRKANSITKQ